MEAGGKNGEKKIDNKIFKNKLIQTLGFLKVVNYYGLIEQTGSIFLECEKCGYFYSVVFGSHNQRKKFRNFTREKRFYTIIIYFTNELSRS